MRGWVKATIAVVLLALVAFLALAGTGAYFFLRHLDTASAAEAEIVRQADGIRARYAARAPLIEIVDLERGDVRVQRTVHPEARRAQTLHVLTWDAESGDRLSTDIPLWLMRFSSVNVLSRLGIAPEKYRLTAEDIAAYGPGMVLDYRQPGRQHVLIWVE